MDKDVLMAVVVLISPLIFLNSDLGVLKSTFPNRFVRLRNISVVRSVTYPAVLAVFWGGMVLAANASNPLLAWGLAISSVIMIGCIFLLHFVGPLYPLFQELADAKDEARQLSDSAFPEQGIQ
jgi:hypothetical protein